MSDAPLVFLDCETTGLDPAAHQVWEIAYAVDDGPILSSFVQHSLANATVEALRVGRYVDRFESERGTQGWTFEVDLRQALRGATLVGANPAFDAAFLKARSGWVTNPAPWSYRLLDIEAYAMPALGLDRPRGLAFIAEQLGVQPPDHIAAGDVHTLRECWRSLRKRYADA